MQKSHVRPSTQPFERAGDRAHPYDGASIALGTKHRKERVVRPQFLLHLGALIVVPPRLDTDQLGTFTGEIERPGPASSVVLQKAKLALSVTGLTLGLASEGSFGPDPVAGFVPCDTEWLGFVDTERGIAIVERETSMNTNFSHAAFGPDERPQAFLENIRFPSHGVIARPNQPRRRPEKLFKGLTSTESLRKAMTACRKESMDGRVRLETDMRAHMNPTRLAVIQALSRKMAKRLARLCELCGCPGWGIVEAVPGLRCETCDNLTMLAEAIREGCAGCAASQMAARPDGLRRAPEKFCDVCNP